MLDIHPSGYGNGGCAPRQRCAQIYTRMGGYCSTGARRNITTESPNLGTKSRIIAGRNREFDNLYRDCPFHRASLSLPSRFHAPSVWQYLSQSLPCQLMIGMNCPASELDTELHRNPAEVPEATEWCPRHDHGPALTWPVIGA